LREGGSHIFSVPLLPGERTASRSGASPVYHADPLRRQGSLVHGTTFRSSWRRLVSGRPCMRSRPLHGWRMCSNQSPSRAPEQFAASGFR
jgi:hypothetical protein